MWVVTNGIKVDPRLRCGGLFGSVRGVCLFDFAIPSSLCLHWGGGGGVCDVPHRIGEKDTDAIYV